MLSRFYTLLKPGGSVLLDAYTLKGFDSREESATYEHSQLDGFWAAEEYFCFVNTFKYEQERVTLDKYTIIEQTRTRTIYNWLQYFTEEAIREEFVSHGFEVDGLYADVAGRPLKADSPEMAIVARK